MYARVFEHVYLSAGVSCDDKLQLGGCVYIKVLSVEHRLRRGNDDITVINMRPY